jgi:photoactive yellow protein
MPILTEVDPTTLPSLSRQELDSLDFGVVKVNDAGVIEIYNTYESQLANVSPSTAQGRNFFTQVAPCTNNRLVFGRFKEGVQQDSLDAELSYTLTYKMRPTNVRMRLYRDSSTKTNWILVQKK